MSKKDVMGLVLGALHDRINYLPVRGLESFSSESGDIDIIVPPGFAAEACVLVSEYAKQNGWYLIGFKDLGYVSSLSLHKPGKSQSDYSIKVDFINGLSWLGIQGNASTTDLFSDNWSACWRLDADQRICGFVTFVQKIMASGYFTEKDWNRIASSGADSQYLIQMCRHFGIPISEAEIDYKKISIWKKWKVRFKSSGKSGLYGFIAWACQVISKTVMFKPGFNYKSGVLISISGMDGSGKSTLVDRFYSSCLMAGGVIPEIIHLLPGWFPMPHQLISRKSTKSNYHRPYSEKPVNSKINGLLRLSYYLVGFLFSKMFIGIRVSRGHVFIQDRSFFDFSSDLSRAKIPDINIPKAIKKLISSNGFYVYLDASPDAVVSRKNELTLEKASSLRSRYLANSPNFKASVINANVSADAVYESFLSILHDFLVRKIKLSMPK